METKCLKAKPKKIQAGKTAALNDITSMKTINKSPVGVQKKPWKKPVLLRGKDICFFGKMQGMPPDPFPDS